MSSHRTQLGITLDAEGWPHHRYVCPDCDGTRGGMACPEHGGGCDCSRVNYYACGRCMDEGDIVDEDCSCSICATIVEELEKTGHA